MKRHAQLTLALITLFYQTNLTQAAEEGHDHSHAHPHPSESEHTKKEAGPNGGRVIKTDDTELEFFVRDDGKVQITFLDHGNAVLPPKDQSVSLIGGNRSAPTKFSFEAGRTLLVSNESIPHITNKPVILSIQNTVTEDTVRERFNLNLSICPNCDYKEYACICGHDERHHNDHEHEGHKH